MGVNVADPQALGREIGDQVVGGDIDEVHPIQYPLENEHPVTRGRTVEFVVHPALRAARQLCGRDRSMRVERAVD